MTGDDANSIQFDAFFGECYPGLVRYLQHMLRDSSRAAEDVAQDAFIILWRKWETTVRDHPSPKAYLYTVARHLAYDTMEALSRVGLKPDLLGLVVAEDSPSDSWDTKMAVQEAIKKLPERQREAVTLFHIHGFPQDEIAIIMNIARGSVGALIHQGRKRLTGLIGWLPGERTNL